MNSHDCKVTCIKPAVFINNLCSQIRALVVALHNCRSLNLKNTFLTAAKNKAVLRIYDAGFYTTDRRTDCSEDWICHRANGNDWCSFCKSIPFYNLNSNCPEEFINYLREGTTTSNTGTEVCSQHSLNLSKDNQISKTVKRPQKTPWDKADNPPEYRIVAGVAGIFVEHKT